MTDIFPEDTIFYIVSDKLGRQILGWSMDLLEPGIIRLYDPMLVGEEMKTIDDQVQINIGMRPIFQSFVPEAISVDVISIIIVPRASKFIIHYERRLNDFKIAIRAAQAGLVVASEMPKGR